MPMTENEGPTPPQSGVSSRMPGEGSVKPVEAGVISGSASWNYIYIFLGFAVSIEATVIGMITPLQCPWNIFDVRSVLDRIYHLPIFG